MNKNVKKAIVKLENAMEQYKKEVSLSLCVSAGNQKIGRINNISVAPVITCHGICKYCKDHCYDLKANLQYPDVVKARARNTVLLRNHPMEFFAQALTAAKRQRKGLFRWNVGGEIDSVCHFEMIVRIAQLVPDTMFLLFTKRHFLVNSWIEKNGIIPENLKLIFSVWPGMEVENPYNFPVSCPYPNEKPETWKTCIGNCEKCAELKIGCWYAEKGDTIGFHYHGTETAEFTAQWEGMKTA